MGTMGLLNSVSLDWFVWDILMCNLIKERPETIFESPKRIPNYQKKNRQQEFSGILIVFWKLLNNKKSAQIRLKRVFFW